MVIIFTVASEKVRNRKPKNQTLRSDTKVKTARDSTDSDKRNRLQASPKTKAQLGSEGVAVPPSVQDTEK